MDEQRELEQLRRLLFERELQVLDRLQEKLNALDAFADKRSRADSVSDVIAEALILRARRDPRLGTALEPLVDDIVKRSLRTKLPEFTNLLFPLMGPSIRKSIAEAFRNMLQSFSKSMDLAFSFRGLRWRIEAIRTGKSFSEVVMLHTLLYRVEQVFFIHSATGISLAHVSGEGVDSQDADMVSAMFTAIQDFAQDCLDHDKTGVLESLQHGEHTIIIERQGPVYLACIVRGTPPGDFREQIRACLENLLIIYSSELAVFNGNVAPFESSRPHLEELLGASYQDAKGISFKGRLILAMLGVLFLGGLGYLSMGLYQDYAFKAQVSEALAVLRREPGLLLGYSGQAENGGRNWEVICFQDAQAAKPDEVLRRNGLDPGIFNFEIVPFVSYSPAIVQKRVLQDLNPPEGVTVELDESGNLILSGSAPEEWIMEARRRAYVLPGIKSVDSSRLSDPRMDQLHEMADQVRAVEIEFPSGKDMPDRKNLTLLARAVDTLVEMEKLASGMGLSMTLTIYGHADATGSDKRNYEISQGRARTIAAMLYARGSSLPVLTYGLGADYASKPKGNDPASRRIEMRVQFFSNGDMARAWQAP